MCRVESVDAVPCRMLDFDLVNDSSVFQCSEITLQLRAAELCKYTELSKCASRMPEDCLACFQVFRPEQVIPGSAGIGVGMAHFIPLMRSSFAGRLVRVRYTKELRPLT